MTQRWIVNRTGYVGIAVLSVAVAAYALGAYALLPLGAVVHPDMRAGIAAQRTAL